MIIKKDSTSEWREYKNLNNVRSIFFSASSLLHSHLIVSNIFLPLSLSLSLYLSLFSIRVVFNDMTNMISTDHFYRMEIKSTNRTKWKEKRRRRGRINSRERKGWKAKRRRKKNKERRGGQCKVKKGKEKKNQFTKMIEANK